MPSVEKNCISRLETDLIKIDGGLEKEDFNGVLDRVETLKSQIPSYKNEESGYLVDFYLGQAIFRKEMESKKKPEELIKSKQYLEDSLKLNPDFKDNHILAGYISMVLANHPKQNDKRYYQLNSMYHLKKAVEIKPSVYGALSSKIKRLEKDLSQVPDVILCSNNQEMVLEWMIEFERFPWVRIVHGNIIKQKADAVVSPANSFGFMDGGLDYTLSKSFGWGLQKRLQQIIRQKHKGELLVGLAEILDTGKKSPAYLVSAPTMRVPMEIKDTMNPYLATRAVFLAIDDFNHKRHRINSVLIPSMGTGVGKVPFDVCARQMRSAYEDTVLQRNKYPSDFADAQQKHRVLSMDHFYKLYDGKY